ncbi:MAG: ribosome maturation factor RimM [Actinobacteria bacterium]|nr:ribosome maturation factor RimM [Actinomycetota bacterium]
MGLLEIGRIVRPHGLRGEVVVQLTTNRAGRLDPGTVFDVETAVLTVTASRPFQDRHLVQFEGIGSREQADDLRGKVLLAEPPEDDRDEDALWVHELIGSSVIDSDGSELGTVNSVENNPASDLLVLDNGGLIPCKFVVSHEDRTVKVDIPEGLIEVSSRSGEAAGVGPPADSDERLREEPTV